MVVSEPNNTLARPQSGAPASSPYVRQLAERFANAAAPQAFTAYAEAIWRSQFNLVLAVLGNEPLVLAAPAMYAALKKAEVAARSAAEGAEVDILSLRTEILSVLQGVEVRA
jgi:hypothetical protein